MEATRAGAYILEQGGNAVDAAVVVALALGSADPGASGLGGMTYVLIHLADGRSVAIDGSATVPLSVDPDKLLELDGVAATVANVRNESYPLRRPLHVLTNGPAQGTLKEFIDFLTSPRGQKIVTGLDFVSVAKGK